MFCTQHRRPTILSTLLGPAAAVGLVVGALAALAPARCSAAKAGSLDPGFDGDGRLAIGLDFGGNNNEDLIAIALQADGKAVAVGQVDFSATDSDFLVVRFDATGSFDPSFDADGLVVVPFDLVPGSNADAAKAVAVQPDGMIVVVGTVTSANGPGNTDIGVVRLLPNGALDPSFGSGGKTTIAFDLGGSGWDTAEGVVLQPDGKIVIAGSAEVASLSTDIAVARLTSSGALDPTFDIDGKVTIAFDTIPGGADLAFDIALQADGKLIVGGWTGTGAGNNMAVARIDSTGALDPEFGTGGRTVFTATGYPWAEIAALALDSAGRIVTAGLGIDLANPSDILVGRLTPSGLPDLGFGPSGDGTAAVDVAGLGSIDRALALVVLPDDRIVVAGYSDAGGTPSLAGASPDVALVQLGSTGLMDGGFGSSGRLLVPFDLGQQNWELASGLALRPDGRLVAVGTADGPAGSGFDLIFVQLFASVVFVDGFESGGAGRWSAIAP